MSITLRKALKAMQKVAQEHPELLDQEMIMAVDDEGNAFKKVTYAPSAGHYDGTYTDKSKLTEGTPVNAVCLN